MTRVVFVTPMASERSLRPRRVAMDLDAQRAAVRMAFASRALAAIRETIACDDFPILRDRVRAAVRAHL